ncbi:hypothetical protein [Streptacidiphilus jiangxiensis]|uniref:Uncharacterized protein n=1 Tax=Streptacidiphilus jiangxiensis TaxID=235985 RepID=A0A1H7X4J7_STRJI|nr:hypothetical protein [Streptacidiphilus jiangxiensis]SEM28792.1 hypothetical protein SAMN05414137_122133 [Streptacidiphilus jiangxiensis]
MPPRSSSNPPAEINELDWTAGALCAVLAAFLFVAAEGHPAVHPWSWGLVVLAAVAIAATWWRVARHGLGRARGWLASLLAHGSLAAALALLVAAPAP